MNQLVWKYGRRGVVLPQSGNAITLTLSSLEREKEGERRKNS
jgi:hypothetical protein